MIHFTRLSQFIFFSGSVHKAQWLSKNRLVACKVITVPRTNDAEVLEKSFMKEVAAYAELSGAYILKTYGFTASKHGQNKRYMIVMEYMSRGSLSNVIKEGGDKISLRRKLDIARNIASGMRKIHEHRMIHRDIRPDNILVNENYVAKIGDMGIARVVDPLNQHTQIGCQSYMPPEFYKGSYDQKLDIFTFGLTLNELFTSKKHSFQPFVNDKIAFQEKSPIFDGLIARCTAYDPKRRPTAIEIEKTLDLYSAGFGELVLKKHPSYINLSTKDKDEIFIAFYEKFHPAATDFIRKQFPPEFLDEPTDMPCVKVDRGAGEGLRIECLMQ
jgi:serine/threonine protein kinase